MGFGIWPNFNLTDSFLPRTKYYRNQQSVGLCILVAGLVRKLTYARYHHWSLAVQWNLYQVQFPLADRLRCSTLVAVSTVD